MRQPIDAETKVIMNGLPFLSPGEQADAAKYAKERIEAFKSGVARTPMGVNDRLVKDTGDDKLQIRWCFDINTWILERWQPDGYWLCVMVILNKFSQTPRLNDTYMRNLVNLLKTSDLQRVNVNDYLLSKRRAADSVKAENRTKSANYLIAAIDALSSRQVQNFIDVHRAIHTGEKIVCHGRDETILNRMAEASRKSPAPPSGKALNPGMHPLIYKRKRRTN